MSPTLSVNLIGGTLKEVARDRHNDSDCFSAIVFKELHNSKIYREHNARNISMASSFFFITTEEISKVKFNRIEMSYFLPDFYY